MTAGTEPKLPDEAASQSTPAWPFPLDPLGPWRFYFLAKLLLHITDLIGFHPWENLAFACLLLLPVNGRLLQNLKNGSALITGIALLYYDSWLPPITRAISQITELASFSLPYLIELLARFINVQVLSMLVVVWILYRIAVGRIRVGILVFAALIYSALVQPQKSFDPEVHINAGSATASPAASNPMAALDGSLKKFYATEAMRQVKFTRPADSAPPFDIIFLHVCSLSWDDVKAMGLENHPLWQHFDILMTRFNSAASYSGPAGIRINRATCGQGSHTGLYSPVPTDCYLMSSLQQANFSPQILLNHDGHFDDFLKTIQAQGAANQTPMPISGLPVPQHAFDDSPIYDDSAVLDRWLHLRQASAAPHVSLYYNTISLHDGNRLSGAQKNRSSLETYKIRLAKLLNDLDHFIQKLQSSGRRAIVVLVPEHGAAVHGDRMQIAGLREIPSPAITTVPVGIKVIGPNAKRQGEPLKASQPTSYLAISQIIENMLQTPPFSEAGFDARDYVRDLPETQFVTENGDMVIMEQAGRFYLRQGKDGWSDYTPNPEAP